METGKLEVDTTAAETVSTPLVDAVEKPISRFNRAAQSVIQMQRLTTQFSTLKDVTAGLPAGVDVNFPPTYIASMIGPSKVTIVDYCQASVKVEQLDNDTFHTFLQNSPAPTKKVRWINIRGVSFDVIKCIANRFNLHPLAVEDIFHVPQRIKVDKYLDHLFISMIQLGVPSFSMLYRWMCEGTLSALPMA